MSEASKTNKKKTLLIVVLALIFLAEIALGIWIFQSRKELDNAITSLREGKV